MDKKDVIKQENHHPTMRVLAILEGLSASEKGHTLTELAVLAGYGRGTIIPIIKTLMSKRYVVQNPDTMRYSLGVSSLVLAHGFLQSNPQLRMISAEMHTCANECSAVCQLGMLDGQFVIYIIKIESTHSRPMVSHVGKHIYATCTALGKALLCDYSLEKIHTLYPDGLPQYTADSIRDYPTLQLQLEEACRSGVTVDNGECDPDTFCYAVPLRRKEHIVAALSVSIKKEDCNEIKKSLLLDSLAAAKKNIELILHSSSDFMLITRSSSH